MRVPLWIGVLVISLANVARAQRPSGDDVLPSDDGGPRPEPAPPPADSDAARPDGAPQVQPGIEVPAIAPPAPGAPPPPAARPSPPVAEPQPAPAHELTMDEVAIAPQRPRLSLNMFGDVAFQLDSQQPRNPAFVLSPLNFLLFGRHGNLIALSEFAFEIGAGGESILVDVERFFVGWHGERFSIEAGRMHTELGYWNNAFHHGRWLQMTIERPRGIDFEDDGGILPIHSVGLTARAHLLTGPQQVDLVAAVANGRGAISDDIQVTADDNLFKSLLLKVETKGFGARDLRFGAAAYYDHIAPEPFTRRPALPDQMIQEGIGNLYVAYRSPGLTFISEAYEIVHIAAAQSWKTFDGFVLAAYRFGTIVPYATGELRAGDIEQDPFYFPDLTVANPDLLGRFKEAKVGVRWDISSWSAIKLEYRATWMQTQGTLEQRGMIDWSFGL
jgi:hypothetical protein